MASPQSAVFRLLAKLLSVSLDAVPSLPRLRALSGAGPGQPRLPPGVTCEPARAEGVPVEWIVAPGAAARPVVLYLHGGAWTLGWYNSHRWLVGHLCLAAKCRALAVDYRLAPENPYPAALEDCVAAYRWLLKNGTAPRDIVVAGDSAGGNLTLTMLMTLREAGDPLPAAAVCLSPMTDLTGSGPSFTANARTDALLSPKFALSNARRYAGDHDPRLPLISPHFGRLDGLPPLLIQAGADEILLSDAERLADQARAAGVEVTLTVWPKMWHVWQVFVPYMPEAQAAVDAIGAFISQHR